VLDIALERPLVPKSAALEAAAEPAEPEAAAKSDALRTH